MAIPTVRVRTICEVSHTVDGGGVGRGSSRPPRPRSACPDDDGDGDDDGDDDDGGKCAAECFCCGSTARTSHTISHRALGRAQPVTQLRYLTAAAQLRYYFGARSALTRSSVSAASVSLWRASTRSKMDAIHVPLHSSACFLAFSNLLKFCATCGRRRGRGRARALLNVTPHDAE